MRAARRRRVHATIRIRQKLGLTLTVEPYFEQATKVVQQKIAIGTPAQVAPIVEFIGLRKHGTRLTESVAVLREDKYRRLTPIHDRRQRFSVGGKRKRGISVRVASNRLNLSSRFAHIPYLRSYATRARLPVHDKQN